MNRVVFLVDMNAFFISCEMTRRPELVGKPAAVAGDPKRRTGIILAANYEARRFGVKTAMVLRDALKLCPNMLLVPPDHDFYEKRSHEVMEILSGYTPVVEQNSIDEAWLDMTGCDKLFGTPIEAAKRIMANIKDELGLMCSIGISENKFLSKMASEMKKPMGITELWRKEIKAKMWPLPVSAVYGIGKQSTLKLLEMNIATIGDLAKSNQGFLVSKLGKYGMEIHQLANGNDNAPVVPHREGEMKSIGRSITLAGDLTRLEDARKVILELTEDIGASARKHQKKGRTVQITIKYSNFKVITRQMTVPATFLTKDIYLAGCQLLEKNWNPSMPVRLLGISIGGFEDEVDNTQISLFDIIETHSPNEKEEKLEKAMDLIRQKHGSAKINRAVLIKKDEK